MGSERHVIVIGGGIAGITAAWRLNRMGVRVTLIEARPELGGRLCSHNHRGLSTSFDNGPHLFLSSYSQTRRLFREMGIEADFEYPWPGSIPYVRSDGIRGRLRQLPLPSPWSLTAGLLNFSLMSWPARCRTVANARELISDTVDPSQSCGDWLSAQCGREELTLFWLPLIKAALNSTPEDISIKDLKTVLQRGFCAGFFGGRLGYALEPFGKLFAEKVHKALEKTGVKVMLRSPSSGAILNGDEIMAVRLKNGHHIPCDAVVAALPPWALSDWLSSSPVRDAIVSTHRLDDWRSNPIHSLYLWAERRPLLEAYTCLPGRNFDWVFDFARIWRPKQGPVCLLSGDTSIDENKKSDDQTPQPWTRTIGELNDAFPQLRPVHWQAQRLIKVRRATPLRPRELWGQTLLQTTPIPNLFLAGDWLDSDLPPTVEAAVRTGERSVELILQKL